MAPVNAVFQFSAILVLISAVSSAAVERTPAMLLQLECNKELAVPKDPELLKEKGGFGYQYKCFMKCVAEKFAVFSENGLAKPKIEEYINKIAGTDEAKLKEYNEAYEKCKDLKEEDPCDTVAKLYNCAKDTHGDLLQEIIKVVTTEVNGDYKAPVAEE